MPSRLIASVIIFAVALALAAFLTWPEYRDFKRLQAEFGQKEAELDSKTKYYSQIEDIWEKREKYQDSLSRIESTLSKGYSLPAIFDYLQTISGQSGLVLEDLTFGGVSGDNIKEITFNLDVSGTYQSFKGFLSSLESSARLFNVKGISFSSPEEGEAFSFKITAVTYSY